MDATHYLGGQNYVLWGGREGYETILNTNMKKELDNLARFLELVVDYKNKIGFKMSAKCLSNHGGFTFAHETVINEYTS